MQAIKAICFTILILTTFVSSNMLLSKLKDSKSADINAFIIESEFGSIDASASGAKLTFDGTSAISTYFTYVYPITSPVDAATLFAQLLRLKNVKIDTKNIYFSFSANEISAVKQKRRGEFGDVYSLEVDRRNQGLSETFQLNILTERIFPDKDALFNIIDQLGN